MRLFNKKNQNKFISPRTVRRADESQALTPNFKRNRTLIATPPETTSSRTNVHHLTVKRRKVFSILITFVILIIFITTLIFNFTASPRTVIADKNIVIPIKEGKYNAVIQDYLEANPLERFKFLLNQTSLIKYVSSKLPEVEQISVNGLRSIGAMNYILKMRKPVAGWVINSKQYYVDSKGVSFEINYYSNPQVQIVDDTGAPVLAGVTNVSKRLLGFVGLAVSRAGKYGYIVTKATLPASTMRQVDISIKDYTYPVKLTVDRPVGEQIEDMDRAQRYFISNGLTPEYIDVRVSNKAFYK